jgi:hypothetical protein
MQQVHPPHFFYGLVNAFGYAEGSDFIWDLSGARGSTPDFSAASYGANTC